MRKHSFFYACSEMIGKERTNQDENIAEYLKLITNADKQQTIRIKAVFDKKNQKSLATIEKVCGMLSQFTSSGVAESLLKIKFFASWYIWCS